jgi:hypothetical protein
MTQPGGAGDEPMIKALIEIAHQYGYRVNRITVVTKVGQMSVQSVAILGAGPAPPGSFTDKARA